KLRLFACACCRRIWHLLTDKRLRETVAVAEDHADGNASAEALSVARDAALAVWRASFQAMTGHPPPEVVSLTVTTPSGQPGVIAYLSDQGGSKAPADTPSPQAAATSAASAVHRAAPPPRLLPASACELAAEAVAGGYQGTKLCPVEGATQTLLLRDMIGNPFRPVALDPASRTPTVRALAQTAYDE